MASDTLAQRPISIDEFMPLLGQTLLADCNPRAAELTLFKVEPYAQRMSARIPFILIFRGSADIQLVAGTYALRCGEFGPEFVHLEPMMPPADAAPGSYYQALFN